MSQLGLFLRRFPGLGRRIGLAKSCWRMLRYHLGSLVGRNLGDVTLVWREQSEPGRFEIEARWPGDRDPGAALVWCRRQGNIPLRVVGVAPRGEVLWQIDRRGIAGSFPATRPRWFCVPDPALPVDPAHWEICGWIAAAEEVDVVIRQVESLPRLARAADVLQPPFSAMALFSTKKFAYSPQGGLTATHSYLVKELREDLAPALPSGPRRRGTYSSSKPLPARLVVGLRDASLAALPPPNPPSDRIPLLVVGPFFARGGAEHTLFETLSHLADRFDYTFVSLAPHRPELGDRRADFRCLSNRLLSLGDWVHPAAMPGILDALVTSTGARVLYNANGSTLFYEFAPGLKQRHPELLIIDHLYDHEVGYIDRYGPALLGAVDLCVAENHHIRDTLERDKGWPRQRVPVIWPCGRPDGTFPPADQRAAMRRRLRQELGLGEEDLVLLTAARMHPQKRPLDLVRLAKRLESLSVWFLLVGGGDLEHEVDQAIARAPGAKIRRLGFRTDIPDLIIAADAGCLVSEYEGLPVFLLECLQAGRPFLGTAVGEMGRVLQETGAGLVVDQPGDLDALEAAVRHLTQPGERSALARRAQEAGQRFDVPSCAERYAKVFLSPVATTTTSPMPRAMP